MQAGKPLHVFGTGKGNISLTLAGGVYHATMVEEDWVWTLPAQPYGGPTDVEFDLNGRRVVLKNVVFGDVFLCAGQSNMRFAVKEEIGSSPVQDDDKIRHYESLPNESGEWQLCQAGRVDEWSALGLHIAQNYRKTRDVYVGIVVCAKGASVIRSWMPQRALTQDVFVPIELRHEDYFAYPDWNDDSFLYKQRFCPIAPISAKGAVWYQGESDTSPMQSKVYTALLQRLIGTWREDLMQPELPFVVVEICDFDECDNEAWHAVQRCQQEVGRTTPYVQVVASKDVCEHDKIHPANKELLAQRIAATL